MMLAVVAVMSGCFSKTQYSTILQSLLSFAGRFQERRNPERHWYDLLDTIRADSRELWPLHQWRLIVQPRPQLTCGCLRAQQQFAAQPAHMWVPLSCQDMASAELVQLHPGGSEAEHASPATANLHRPVPQLHPSLRIFQDSPDWRRGAAKIPFLWKTLKRTSAVCAPAELLGLRHPQDLASVSGSTFQSLGSKPGVPDPAGLHLPSETRTGARWMEQQSAPNKIQSVGLWDWSGPPL